MVFETEMTFKPPVREINITESSKTLITVHPVRTTLSPHEMKQDNEILEFLDDNGFGFALMTKEFCQIQKDIYTHSKIMLIWTKDVILGQDLFSYC